MPEYFHGASFPSGDILALTTNLDTFKFNFEEHHGLVVWRTIFLGKKRELRALNWQRRQRSETVRIPFGVLPLAPLNSSPVARTRTGSFRAARCLSASAGF